MRAREVVDLLLEDSYNLESGILTEKIELSSVPDQRTSHNFLLMACYLHSCKLMEDYEERTLDRNLVQELRETREVYREALEKAPLLCNKPLHSQQIRKLDDFLRAKVLTDGSCREEIEKTLKRRN